LIRQIVRILRCRKAELALGNVELQELTAKGMVFERLPVAYGKKIRFIQIKMTFPLKFKRLALASE